MIPTSSTLFKGLCLLGLTTLVQADECALTATNNGISGIDLGGSSTNAFSGFFLQINGGEKITLEVDNGNGFPNNYQCGSSDPEYAMAYFSDTPKGKLGMCITDSTGIVPGRKFNCEDQGGKKFEGNKDSTFYGIGVSASSFCTIVFEC